MEWLKILEDPRVFGVLDDEYSPPSSSDDDDGTWGGDTNDPIFKGDFTNNYTPSINTSMGMGGLWNSNPNIPNNGISGGGYSRNSGAFTFHEKGNPIYVDGSSMGASFKVGGTGIYVNAQNLPSNLHANPDNEITYTLQESLNVGGTATI